MSLFLLGMTVICDFAKKCPVFFFFGVISRTNTFYAFLVTCLLSKPCVVLLRCCCFISQFVHKTNTRKYQILFYDMTIIVFSRKKKLTTSNIQQKIKILISYFRLFSFSRLASFCLTVVLYLI